MRRLGFILALVSCNLQDDVLEVQDTTNAESSDSDSDSDSDSALVQDCSDPPCLLSCEGAARCDQSCVGDCSTECKDADACDITCSGPAPSCVSSCSNVEECRLSCPQGNCVLLCTDVSSCHIEDCTDNCVVTCGGAEDCSVSCSVGAGCVQT